MMLTDKEIDRRIEMWRARCVGEVVRPWPSDILDVLIELREARAEVKRYRKAMAECLIAVRGCEWRNENDEYYFADEVILTVCHKHGIDPDAPKGGTMSEISEDAAKVLQMYNKRIIAKDKDIAIWRNKVEELEAEVERYRKALAEIVDEEMPNARWLERILKRHGIDPDAKGGE